MSSEQASSSTDETIKIIGAGFGRTTSLKKALEILGFRCYHFQELFNGKNIRTHANHWIQAYDGHLSDYDIIFKSNQVKPYTATVDWPSTAVWEDLIKQYPHAKVILTVRDSENWYKSARSTIYPISKNFPTCYMAPSSIRRLNSDLVWAGTFQNRFEDKQFAIDIYEKHNERVKQIVPKDRLLILDVTKNNDGNQWKELCEFLDIPPPEMPFPRTNDTKEFQAKIRQLKRIGWTVIFISSSFLIGLLSIVMFYVLK